MTAWKSKREEEQPLVAFKQYVKAEIADGFDESHQFENWAADAPGRTYYDVHLSVIEKHETCVPTLRRLLGEGGKRILESGCGTGRWIAYFERLGHRCYGVDDSTAPLHVAREHSAELRLVQADAVACPFKADSFDVVFSSYVAEHFENGPEPLFREIRRLLKPKGLLLVIVPYNNLLRRLLANRILQCFYLLCRLRGRPLGFAEFRYSRREMDGFLQRSGFRIEHVEPDDFRLPWAKGLSLDLAPLVLPRSAAPGSWELNRFGRTLAWILSWLSPWLCCSGVLYAARRVG